MYLRCLKDTKDSNNASLRPRRIESSVEGTLREGASRGDLDGGREREDARRQLEQAAGAEENLWQESPTESLMAGKKGSKIKTPFSKPICKKGR